MFSRSSATWLVGLLVAIGTHRVQAQTVAAIPQLDKKALTGSWYEIARYPNKREKHCVADAIELIALGDKTTQLQLVDACTDVKGYKDSWNFTAMNKTDSGMLKVRTIFPFTRKYWVLAVGPIAPVAAPATGYSWTLIGMPNHKGLWVYARTATLPADELGQIKAKAAMQGFDPAMLVILPQSQQ